MGHVNGCLPVPLLLLLDRLLDSSYLQLQAKTLAFSLRLHTDLLYKCGVHCLACACMARPAAAKLLGMECVKCMTQKEAGIPPAPLEIS